MVSVIGHLRMDYKQQKPRRVATGKMCYVFTFQASIYRRWFRQQTTSVADYLGAVVEVVGKG